jgi:hypothetical protein
MPVRSLSPPAGGDDKAGLAAAGRRHKPGPLRRPPGAGVYLYMCYADHAGSLDVMGLAVLRQSVVRARSRRYPESGSWRIAPNVCAT